MAETTHIDFSLGVIGAGAMGSSIAGGLVASGAAEAKNIVACDPSAERRKALEAMGIRAYADAQAMLAGKPGVVVIAVKPQVLPLAIAPFERELADTLVISIAAGVRVATLEELLPASRIIRVMPNLPVQVLSGATAVCPGKAATRDDVDRALAIFGALGTARVMREDQLDAEGAVVSCGPAYVALFVDALTRAGVELGMSAADCRAMVLSTMRGVCEQLARSGEHPRAYMEKVTSPGGTTAAGLRAMEQGLVQSVYAGADAALARTRELAQGG